MSLLLLFLPTGEEPPPPEPEETPVVYQMPPLRLGVWYEDLEYRRDLWAKMVSTEPPAYSVCGGGSLGVTIGYWNSDGSRADMSRRSEWYRTLVVMHHPLLPPMPLAPTQLTENVGLNLTVKMCDAAFWCGKRMIQVPNGPIGHEDLRGLIHEALTGNEPTPIRDVVWRAQPNVFDCTGVWQVQGRYVIEILDMLATERGLSWWVEWDEEAGHCRLVIAELAWTEPSVHISLPDIIQRPVIHEDLETIGNYGLCAIYYGQLAGREFFWAKNDESIKTYGLREIIIPAHSQDPRPEVIVERSSWPEIELPFAILGSALSGVKLGDTVMLELPGQNYRMIVQGIGLSPDGANAVIQPYAFEEV